MTDIVIPVRPGDNNEELRFALRSWEQNYPHNSVWIVGHKPNWVTNVHHIPGNSAPHSRANLWWNLLAYCQHPDTPDDFVAMNDDFFVTEPITRPEVFYRGTLKDHIALKRVQRGASWWRDSLNTTLICLQALGHKDPLSYELHVPFPANKQLMCETLQRFSDITPHNPIQWRTTYGVLNNIGGTQTTDSKAYGPGEIRTPYHSTDDVHFRYYARQLKQLFPTASRYEKQ